MLKKPDFQNVFKEKLTENPMIPWRFSLKPIYGDVTNQNGTVLSYN